MKAFLTRIEFKVKALFYLSMSWKLNFHYTLCQGDQLHFFKNFFQKDSNIFSFFPELSALNFLHFCFYNCHMGFSYDNLCRVLRYFYTSFLCLLKQADGVELKFVEL